MLRDHPVLNGNAPGDVAWLDPAVADQVIARGWAAPVVGLTFRPLPPRFGRAVKPPPEAA